MNGEFAVMDSTGDKKTMWDTDRQVEMEAAKEEFEKLQKNGYVAYRVKKNGEKGEVMSKFDPYAGSMILAPMLEGG